MRFRNSAVHCAPVCYVQAEAHRHDVENKVHKSFTYVHEEGQGYTLKDNLEDLSSSLADLVVTLGTYKRTVRNAYDRRRKLADIKDLLYTLKALAFEIEGQLMSALESKDVNAIAEAGKARNGELSHGRCFRDKLTGRIQSEASWKETFDHLRSACSMYKPGSKASIEFMEGMWGGPAYEDNRLVEVVRNADGDWVERE